MISSASRTMRDIADPRSAFESKNRVTSSVVSMNANTRTRENCSRNALTSSRVKWLNPATEPDTSHITTSSGRARFGLRCTRSIGTPPVDMDLRNVRRRSIEPARERLRRTARRLANKRARGATFFFSVVSSASDARKKSTSSASFGTPYVATRSLPRFSAVRRRVSFSTILRKSAMRCAAVRLATSD